MTSPTSSPKNVIKWVRPDTASRCTWTPNQPNSASPHVHLENNELLSPPRMASSILDCINNTPLVKLTRIAKKEGLQCELLAKCEFFNPGGSLKDRTALRMIEEAERDGTLSNGVTIIEPSSGNTGIGVALVSAVKGYRCIIVVTNKISCEKESILKALGAEIVKTSTLVAFDSQESIICTAWKIRNEIPRSHILNQPCNPYNPIDHFDITAEEILQQCDSKLDMIVIAAGTGGTLSGISRKFKQVIPNCQVIGVDAHGSLLSQPESLNSQGVHFYYVEGIGGNFIPTVLDRRFVDKWVKTDDKESFIMARRLVREEGLLCGESSGSVMVAAIKEARKLSSGQRCVVILPDSIRNCMTKLLNDKWMIKNGFLEPELPRTVESNLWWWNLPISSLKIQTLAHLSSLATFKELLQYFSTSNSSYGLIPIIENGSVLGIVKASSIMSLFNSGDPIDCISKLIDREFPFVEFSSTLGFLSKLLEDHSYAICLNDKSLVGIITHLELFGFISSNAIP